MAWKVGVRARWLLTLSLLFVLLVSGQSGVRAADPQAIAYITKVFRAAVVTDTMNPLQAAIGESDAISCLDNPPTGLDNPSRDECIINTIPPAYIQPMAVVITLVAASQNYLPGTWATRSIYPGQGAVGGLMTIGNDNVGTLTSSDGTATFIFGRCNTPDCGDVSIVYAYRTSAGDRGSGVLAASSDGCLMYGAFHSTSDPKTIGNFLMARC